MEVIPFTLEHLNQYNHWLKLWNLKEFPPSFYPNTGLFINNHGAVFLYLTGTDIAFAENFVVNPNLSKTDKTKTIDLLTNSLYDLAKFNNVKLLIGSSHIESFINRAKEKHWEISKYKYNLMFKTIGEL